MNIGIDIDDTISTTFETTLPYLKDYIENEIGSIFNLDLNSNIDYYKLSKRFNITEEQELDFWERYFIKIVNEVLPKQNSVEIINKLKQNGHKIVFITARFKIEG